MRAGAIAVALAVLSGAAPPALAASYDDIVAKGEMVVAVYRDFPPFSERRNGTLEGIDVDLARAIGQRMKLGVTFMELTAGESVDDDLRNAVWKGHYLDHRVADLMMHVPVDRAFALRNTNVVIFGPYYRERIALARNPDKVGASEGVAAFAEEKVGVETATLPDLALASAEGGRLVGNVVHFPALDQAVHALEGGQVAAVMGNETELAAALGDQAPRFPVGPIAFPALGKSGWELGLAVKDSNHQLGYAVEDVMTALRKDGTVQAIFRRHGIPYVPPESDE